MTVKGFFKSNVFKCLITLLCVLLVSGVFLTVMNGLLEVSDQERLDRAINKIYGKSVAYTEVDVANYNDNATIDAAYRIKDDGNYLVKVTGKGGFDNGTVTCWVVVNVTNGAVNGIDKVVLDSNKGQSYIDRITDSVLKEFTDKYEDGIIYTPTLITGATVTSTKNAICNAVNGAIDYVNGKWLGNVTTAGQKLLTSLQAIYGDKTFTVYGLDENGEPKAITAEDETFTGYLKTPTQYGNATVEEVYVVTFAGEPDKAHFVISSTGKGGFKDGTVTCRTTVEFVKNTSLTIYDVTITDNVSQSYIGNIDFLDNFKGENIIEAPTFTPTGNHLTSGATLSSTAICNAVNGAIKYLDDVTGGMIDFDSLLGSLLNGGETEEGGNENE